MAKNLVAKAKVGVTTDQTGVNQWLTLTNSDSFISNLETNQGNANNDSVEQFNTLVSGVPSPWARVNLTSYALLDETPAGDTRILIESYRRMRDEWRGLIAAYVLNSDRFKLSKPIPLSGKTIEESYGRLDTLTVLGKMLFKDLHLWKYSTEDKLPYIQMLYYSHDGATKERPLLIGATSPTTLFFLSSNYSLKGVCSDIYWIDDEGKFTDPTKPLYRERINSNEGDKSAIKKVVSFLKNISSNTEAYVDALVKVCGDEKREHILRMSENMNKFIQNWLRDIADISPDFVNVDKNTVPVSINSAVMPAGPIAKLFDLKYTYYWFDGSFLLSNNGIDGAIEIANAQELFVESNYLLGFRTDDIERFKNAPITYIHAQDKQSNNYFCALPFSRFAIEKCLRKEIDQIVKGNNDKVKIIGTVNGEVIKVVLRAQFTAGTWVDIVSKEYTIIIPDVMGHVFTWPNFASKIWNKYYFYSEYPTNGSGIKVMPVFKSLDEESVIDFDKAQINNLSEDMAEMYLVKYPINKVDSTAHRYEIMRSKYPVSLLAVKVNRDDREHSAGYLVLKTQTDSPANRNAMRIITTEADTLVPTNVGIDFGSTNTCAYYSSRNEESSHAVPFTNRRLALLGFDNALCNLAQKHELYFISNEEPINRNGQIKSWLHLHNPLYYDEAKAANELVGGVPVNETNITVHAITENEITTNAGTLCSNMKWLSDRKGRDCKSSYMTTVWLQICADLFDSNKKPDKLSWSYPSAMSRRDVLDMKRIYQNLKQTPIENVVVRNISSHTESEAVCSYAMTKEVALTEKRLFLGIDIGGSTSDILIMGRRNGDVELFSQCSLRIAANHFFKAINSSERFRKALHRFHNSGTTKVRVINIDDIISTNQEIYQRSPYYLNNIFDQLNGGEFFKFYNSLCQNASFAFSLPAYVTGILVFYAGMLVRNTIRVNSLDGIEQVNMRYYGKGGRTFEWIFSVYEEEAKAFYRKCFRAGFGDDAIKFKCDNLDDLFNGNTVENKSEVAMGLVNLNTNIKGIYQADDEDELATPTEFMSEVFGEPGFTYTNRNGERLSIGELEIVNGEFYHSLNNPDEFSNFFKFINIYAEFLSNSGVADLDIINLLKKGRTRIENVMQFFDNDKEYRKYQDELNGAVDEIKPSYRMPVFIAEALYYMEKVLLPNVFKE